MVVSNYLKQITAYGLKDDITYITIGSGSGTVANTDTTLNHEMDRQSITAAYSGTLYRVKFQGDWNSMEMSGLTLKEWGLIGSYTALTGSVYTHTVLPSISFDGTNELRIEETIIIY